MGRKELRKKVRTLEQHIQEHGRKVLTERAKSQPDEGRIRHWETEIKAFRDGINRARKRLGDGR
jgi:ubiquinone biosynthesis protein UbiJ